MDLHTLLTNPALVACWLEEATMDELLELAGEIQKHLATTCRANGRTAFATILQRIQDRVPALSA